MRQTVSFEKVGTTALFFMVVTDNNGARVSGLDETDFSFTLFNPAESDIAGATSITVSELGSSGAYFGYFTLPSAFGEYTLTLVSPVHPPVTGRTVTFLAFAKDYGASGDSFAQIDFKVVDEDGVGVTGLLTADFTLNLWNPSQSEVSGTVAVTFLELSNGGYRALFSALTAQGKWFLDLLTTDGDGGPNYWTPGGKQGVHKYLVETTGIVPGQPSIAAAVNDGNGTSATLTLVADDPSDELFVYYRAIPSGLWVLFGSSRTDSGDLVITGLSNNQMYEFMCIASRSGSPTLFPSLPSEPVRAFVTDGASALTAIRQALLDWVEAETGLVVMWAPVNNPQITRPMVTIRHGGLIPIGEDSHLGPDDSGEDVIRGDREFMFQAEVQGTKSPDGDWQAIDIANTIASSLQKDSVVATLSAVGIGIVEALATQDLGAIESINYFARTLAEVRFRIGNEVIDTVNWIETADSPSGTVTP